MCGRTSCALQAMALIPLSECRADSAQGAMHRRMVRNPHFFASSVYLKRSVIAVAARGLCKGSEVQGGAAAAGNDVCKEYKASRVAYDYSTRGEDWTTNAEWKCAHSSITLCPLGCLSLPWPDARLCCQVWRQAPVSYRLLERCAWCLTNASTLQQSHRSERGVPSQTTASSPSTRLLARSSAAPVCHLRACWCACAHKNLAFNWQNKAWT